MYSCFFTGIVNCAIIAEGLIAACSAHPLKYPVVIRLEGTNSSAARVMLEKSGLPLKMINDVDEAAKTVIKLAQLKA